MCRNEEKGDKVFTETAKALSAFHMTNKTFAKYKNVQPYIGKPRIKFCKIDKPEGTNKSTWVIPKTKEAGPGSYATELAIVKSQWGAVKGPVKATSPNVCFVDKYKNQFKHVPGAGAYQKVDDYVKTLHKDATYNCKHQ